MSREKNVFEKFPKKWPKGGVQDEYANMQKGTLSV